MKIIIISDTHNKHRALKLPPGELLIHAGDVSMSGKKSEIDDFLNWFASQDYTYKIFIAGNHDFYFEREPEDAIRSRIPDGIVYLNDELVVIDGIKIWGSPITPWFFDWAFNRHRGIAIRRHWDLIPADTDILITHGPHFPILDQTGDGKHVGCGDLAYVVGNIKPRLHIFGHIHEAYGTLEHSGTT